MGGAEGECFEGAAAEEGGAHMSDGLVAETTTWREALEVALGAERGSILLEETAASQRSGTAATGEVLRVPGTAQSCHHLRVAVGEGQATTGPMSRNVGF